MFTTFIDCKQRVHPESRYASVVCIFSITKKPYRIPLQLPLIFVSHCLRASTADFVSSTFLPLASPLLSVSSLKPYSLRFWQEKEGRSPKKVHVVKQETQLTWMIHRIKQVNPTDLIASSFRLQTPHTSDGSSCQCSRFLVAI